MIHSCLIRRLEALQRNRYQLHLEALRKERNQRRRKIIFNMMTRLQRKNPATRFYHGQDITGNEDNSISRELSKCFTNNYYEEWSGFYNHGYPASSQHRHMFWYVKYRETSEPHKDHWYTDSDKQLMHGQTIRMNTHCHC